MSQVPSEVASLSVLYVEDDPEIRETFAGYLKKMVRQVWTAKDGEEGLKLFEQKRPDIVITDIKMPRMDGLEMTRRLRALGNKTPVIITTAHGETDLLFEAVRIGINEFLLKPFEMERVFVALEKYAYEAAFEREFRQMRALLVSYKRVIDDAFFFFRTDLEFNLSYLNTYLCEHLGCRDFEFLGRPMTDLLDASPAEIQGAIAKRNLAGAGLPDAGRLRFEP